jgi:hypothetical protein
MVGYADDHSPDTYRMYNPDTKKVILSRDVRWADWKCTDPYTELNVFRQVAKTKNETPVGIDDVASQRSVDSNAPHVIPDDLDDDKSENLEVASQNGPHRVPIQNTINKNPRVPPVPSPVHIQREEDENIITFEPEGRDVFDNRHQWVPPAYIEVGRMTEDPSDEIRSICDEPRPIGDEPTIHHRNTRQPIFSPGRRIGSPDRIPNEPRINLFPPNEAGRMRVAASTQSPQSLNTPQLAHARQVLRDLREQTEDTLDAYEEWEADYNQRRDAEAENLRN